MAHDIAVINGMNAVFTVGALPWHLLGQNVAEAQNWEQAMKLAQLDWDVEKIALLHPVNSSVLPVFGMFRSTDKQFLGTVRDRYEPIQNRFAFSFVDALIGQDGAHYESAGALRNGERIWCLARLPNAGIEPVPGDIQQTYLLFTTSHDGSLSAQAKLTIVRVVCQNTLSSALRSQGFSVKVKHTESAREKLEFAQKTLSGAVRSAKEVEDKLRRLSERRMTKESFKAITERLFPVSDNGEVSTRSKNILGEILEKYESNDGNAFPSIRGSAYNLLNAVTEYTDHSRSSRVTASQPGSQEQARAESALFGSGDAFKSRALEVILEATVNGPSMARTVYSTPTVPVDDGYFDRLSSMIDFTPKQS